MRVRSNIKHCLIALIVLVLTFFISVNLYQSWKLINDKKKEKTEVEKEIVKLRKQEERLNSNVEKLKDPDYAARYLREKFLFSKDGEIIIRITDKDSEA